MDQSCVSLDAVIAGLCGAFAGAAAYEHPFTHWTVSPVFPVVLADALATLPFRTVRLNGVSGKRELHNDQRHYFNRETNARFQVCADVAEAFQSAAVVNAIARLTGADLAGGYVRLEYAQDTDGFWLAPHTDLGVKTFTMLIYLGGEDQSELGTDLYADPQTWAKRTPFIGNTAVVFTPGDKTWHGLAPRPIKGVRRSVIMNYVTDAWRERGQLAFPDQAVR